MFNKNNPSPRYLELQTMYKQMHIEGDKERGIPPEHTFPGASLPRQVLRIKKIIEHTKAKDILDYGCGKGALYRPEVTLKFESIGDIHIKQLWNVNDIYCYDPCYEPFNKYPTKKYDGVISTDVLEHIPEGDIAWVIEELFSLSNKFVFANIACFPAKKKLPNGENAHCTVKEPKWWHHLIQSISVRYPNIVFQFWCTEFIDGNARDMVITNQQAYTS